MPISKATNSALHNCRVLDLTEGGFNWCGKVLADLGADVIKVEPPTGDETRKYPPYYDDQPDKDRSLYFWHYNTNKRSLTLDIATEQGRDLFLRLAATADVIIESFAPGYLENLGL